MGEDFVGWVKKDEGINVTVGQSRDPWKAGEPSKSSTILLPLLPVKARVGKAAEATG